MRRAGILMAVWAALGGAAAGAVPGISNIRYDSLTHASVRLRWTVTAPSYVQVKYGVASGAYPYKTYSIGKLAEAAIAITGLKPATTYYFRVTAWPNDGNTTDICQTDQCGAVEQAITTPPEPGVHPELPQRPAAMATAEPDTTGYTVWTVKNAADGSCVWSDDGVTGLQNLLKQASYGTIIEFPQGITCKVFRDAQSGRNLILPGKPVDPQAGGNMDSPNHRWIILRTGGPAEALAPEGTRTGPAWSGKMAKLEAQQASPGGGDVFESDTWCQETPHHYRIENLELTHAAGPDLFPPDAVDPKPMGALVYMTTRYCPAHQPKYILMDRLYLHGRGFPARIKYGVNLEGEAVGLINSWIEGIDYWRPYETPVAPVALSADKTSINVPQQAYRRNKNDTPWTIPGPAAVTLNADPAYTGDVAGYLGPEGLTVEYTEGRALVSCTNCTAVQRPAPAVPDNRFKWFTGKIANSRFDLQFVADSWNTSAHVTEGSVGVMTLDGAGPYEISNNHIEAYGIGYFIDDWGGLPAVPSDMAFRRNRIYRNQDHRFTSATSNGFKYLVRQQWEIKRGKRFWLDGNIFHGNWASVTQGSTIALSTAGAVSTPGQGTADITITNNVIRNSSGGLYCNGLSRSAAGDPPVGQRVLFANNLVYGIDQFEYDAESPNGRGDLIRDRGCQDLTIRNNTFGSNVGTGPWQLMFLGPPGEGLAITDNILYLNFGMGSFGGILVDGEVDTYMPRTETGPFQRILETGAVRAAAAVEPNYQFKNNVIIGGVAGETRAALRDIGSAELAGYAAQYPAGNFFPQGATKAEREGQVKFADLSRNNFRLAPESPYRGKGSGGGDVGFDAETLVAALGLVQEVKPVEAGETTAKLAYTAPDGRACQVDTSADGATWARTADGGGARPREVTLSGLEPDTDYECRILCYFEQVNDAGHPDGFSDGQITRGTFRTSPGAGLDAPLTVELRAPAAAGAVQAMIEFGETAALGKVTAPVACESGCRVELPSVARRPLFYRWKYLNGQGHVVKTSAITSGIAK